MAGRNIIVITRREKKNMENACRLLTGYQNDAKASDKDCVLISTP
jgi:hypothetical protein